MVVHCHNLYLNDIDAIYLVPAYVNITFCAYPNSTRSNLFDNISKDVEIVESTDSYLFSFWTVL